jgi:hypothetical protein
MNIKEENISSTAECIEYEQFITWSSVTLTEKCMELLSTHNMQIYKFGKTNHQQKWYYTKQV